MVICGNLGEIVPVAGDDLSSDEQDFHPTASLDENCIAFKFRKDRSHYVYLRQCFFGFETGVCQKLRLWKIQQHKS